MVRIVRTAPSTRVMAAATVLFVLVATLSGTAVPAAFTQKKGLGTVSEKLLSRLDSSAVLESLASSPDARRVVYVARAGAKQCVVVDGKKEKCYEAIGYWDTEPFGGRSYWGEPIFSPDSRRLAYVARNEEKWFVVVNGEQQGPYDDINPISLTFSPDGQRMAYVVGASLEQSVVVDGKKEKTYDAISELRFSPDGRRLAYWAGAAQWRLVVVNSREGKPYQERGIFYLNGDKRWVSADMRGLAFSPDSQRLAYSAIFGPWAKLFEGKYTYNENTFIVVNGKEQQNLYVEIYDGPIFSPDSRRLMYTAYEESTPYYRDHYSVVVVDETEQKHYDDVLFGTLHFSPDSERVAYGAKVGANWFVVVDGKEEGPYDEIWGPRSNVKHEVEILRNSSSVRPSGPTFSPDSRRIAYGARVGARWFVVVDGKQEGPYDDIVDDPVFSPDSQSVAYGARIGEKYFVVADGKKSKAYDDLVRPKIVFDTAKAFHYLAVRNTHHLFAKGKHIYLVEQTIE